MGVRRRLATGLPSESSASRRSTKWRSGEKPNQRGFVVWNRPSSTRGNGTRAGGNDVSQVIAMRSQPVWTMDTYTRLSSPWCSYRPDRSAHAPTGERNDIARTSGSIIGSLFDSVAEPTKWPTRLFQHNTGPNAERDLP